MKLLINYGILLFSIASFSQTKPAKPSDLPEAALDFLQKNFRTEAIHHVKKNTDGTKVTYEVMMASGVEIEFLEDGTWKEVDGEKKPIPTKFIEKSILDYVAANYPKDKIEHIEREIRTFDVDLLSGIELKFDLSGKFLSIDK